LNWTFGVGRSAFGVFLVYLHPLYLSLNAQRPAAAGQGAELTEKRSFSQQDLHRRDCKDRHPAGLTTELPF
jgi:hypothetical protein